MTNDDAEEIGLLSDQLDNALHAARLPLPPAIHIEGMTAIISNVRDRLRALVIQSTGEDPWEHHP